MSQSFHLTAILTIALGALASAPAYAIRGEAINLSMFRQELRSRTPNQVSLVGDLRCEFAAADQACNLTFRDSKSGRDYAIIGDAKADVMKLYLGGKRQVALEGSVSDADAGNLQVTRAKSR